MKYKKIKQLLLNLSKNWPSFVRKQVLRIVGFGDVEMRKNVLIDSYRNVKFGQGVFVNYGTQFYTSGGGETVLKVWEIKIKINLNKAPKNTLKIALKPLKKYYLIYYITSIYID